MNKCMLCTSEKKDDVLCGAFLNTQGIAVHSYCLYLTSNLVQNGDDNNGLMGFLPHDIKEEVKRIAPLRCSYCGHLSANIGCCERKCRSFFHFTCGLEHNCLNEFTGTFKSFCRRHVPEQRYKPSANEVCCICYDRRQGPNEQFSSVNMIHAPCCQNGWFHKRCLQKYANTSGYFFKCPLCNDAQIFRKKLSKNCIFIPERDASWELEPNAFAELFERPSKCSAKICISTLDRNIDSDNDPFMICNTCGSVAYHESCNPSGKVTFCCEDCKLLLANMNIQQVEKKEEEEDINVVDNSDTSDDEFTTLRKRENKDNSNENDDDDANKSHHSRSDLVPQKTPSARHQNKESDINDENYRNANMPEVTQPSMKHWDECSTDTNSNICPKRSQSSWKCTTESSEGESLLNTAVENRKSLSTLPSTTNSSGSCHSSPRNSANNSPITLNCINRRTKPITSSDSRRGSSSSSSSSNYKNNYWEIQASGAESDTSDSNDKINTHRPYTRVKHRKRRLVDSESSSSSLKPCPKSKKVNPIVDSTSCSDSEDPVESYSVYLEQLLKNPNTVQKITPVTEDEWKRNCHLAVNQISNVVAGSKLKNSILKERDEPTRNAAIGNAVKTTNNIVPNVLNTSCIARRTRKSCGPCVENVTKAVTNDNVLNVSCIAKRTRRRTVGHCSSQTAATKLKNKSEMNHNVLAVNVRRIASRTTTQMESENAQHSKADISCVGNRTRRRRPLAALKTYFEA